jgi:hypothetical protein
MDKMRVCELLNDLWVSQQKKKDQKSGREDKTHNYDCGDNDDWKWLK